MHGIHLLRAPAALTQRSESCQPPTRCHWSIPPLLMLALPVRWLANVEAAARKQIRANSV